MASVKAAYPRVMVSTWMVSHMLSRRTGTSGEIEPSRIGTLSARIRQMTARAEAQAAKMRTL